MKRFIALPLPRAITEGLARGGPGTVIRAFKICDKYIRSYGISSSIGMVSLVLLIIKYRLNIYSTISFFRNTSSQSCQS